MHEELTDWGIVGLNLAEAVRYFNMTDKERYARIENKIICLENKVVETIRNKKKNKEYPLVDIERDLEDIC